MKYRREIDGLRSFAVLPVIFYHAGIAPFSGGYIGVDVFFVISGFLITSLLADEMTTKRYSLLRFYERRARRLLPALVFVLGLSTIGAFAVLSPPALVEYAKSLIASAMFVANVHFWLSSGYFAPTADEIPLLHIWSLAVEEQFYLIFPPLLFLLWRLSLRHRMTILWTAAVLSFLLCVIGIKDYPEATFFLLPTRAWELLAGSLCALHLQGRERSGNGPLALGGLILILVAAVAFQESTPFPSHFALLPVGGTVLILRYAAPGQIAYRVLTWAPLVGIGLISYSAYLWHEPLLVLTDLYSYDPLGLPVRLGIVALTLVLAALTWRFVEQPFRGRTPSVLPGQKALLNASAASLIAMAALGYSGTITGGWQALWDMTRRPEIAAMYRLFEAPLKVAADPYAGACRFGLGAHLDDTAPLETIEPELLDCWQQHGGGIAILGDSHSSDLYHAVLNQSKAPFVIGFGRGGCRFHDTKPHCSFEDLAAFIEQHPDVFRAIIYEQAAYPMLSSEKFGDSTRKMFKDLSPNEPMPDYQPIRKRIAEPRDYLAGLPEGPRIIWFGPRPAHYLPERYILSKGCNYPFQLRENGLAPFRALDTAILKSIDGTRIEYVSQVELMDLSFPEDLLTCDAIYWNDGDHLSAAGEVYFGKRFDLLRRLGLDDTAM